MIELRDVLSDEDRAGLKARGVLDNEGRVSLVSDSKDLVPYLLNATEGTTKYGSESLQYEAVLLLSLSDINNIRAR